MICQGAQESQKINLEQIFFPVAQERLTDLLSLQKFLL